MRYVAGSSGPHSDIVDERAGCLEGAGVLRTDGEDISVTRLGRAVAGRIAGGEERRTLARINEYKSVFNDLTLEELFAYAYSAYLDMAAGALARDRTESNRERPLMSMLRKGKITSERVSELLDRPIHDILKLAGRMRIQTLR